jgi:hypothetical protein
MRGKDGTACISLSLSPTRTLVTPYCKRTRPGCGTNMKAAGFPFYACLPPASTPFALRLAPTHLGWGTRRQFTRRSRDPRVRNADTSGLLLRAIWGVHRPGHKTRLSDYLGVIFGVQHMPLAFWWRSRTRSTYTTSVF